jgi:hypothetical protein
MRLGAALALVLVLLGSGCGGGNRRAETTPSSSTRADQQATRPGLRVGLVGPVSLDVSGVVPVRGRLEQVAGAPLVLVERSAASLEDVAVAARAHPASHFALVGESTKGNRAPNLVGLVIDDAAAARLGGVVAGLVAADAGGTAPRVAWVGPLEHRLVDAFTGGVHRSLPSAVVLREPAQVVPAQCKEAALAAVGRGAMVVMAARGICARAAVAGADEQNVPGLMLADFEFPNVVSNLVAREALGGSYHGGEDLLFGIRSGAVGVGPLDGRISVAALVRARAAAQALTAGAR